MRPRLLAQILAAAGVLVAGTLPMHAGTSSWYRETEVSKPPPGKSVKIKPTPKAAPKSGPATGQKADTKIFVEPTGEDAAYIAFDQGQYLTALKLAEEEAAKGSKEAYTLMGEIYAEGLGVAQDLGKAADAYAK
ncbi:MAG: sel1 repeat family protein, partial [Hyphomicrobiaceae bacterium]|nr:sel1 repeat family protein [Hyphomicrobiaceae bacterium]